MHVRQIRHPGVIASVVATVLAVAVVSHAGERGTHNVAFADSIAVEPTGVVGIRGVPGVVAITTLVAIDPLAPITLLDARPFHMTPGTELVAARVTFWGRGTSASGHRMFPGLPIGDCSRGVEGGYGATYPVEGIRLKKGDPAHVVFYVRSHDVGREVVTGYRIRYRTARGAIRTVTADFGRAEVDLIPGSDDCDEHVSGWAQPVPGYPG